ncbi:succinate dehydrogenase assembly factor 4, mitochondrial-like [Anastrepha obliqua]|uniref:succinate dehydrogenase assembly factor 4, mitochondrial-like n=1 Tax=Anastrepha ludens TaxID=28586 RepID=UPI0023AF4512|nr:succinate dehydrogenase assembly factor 4, mitochondrial-like [Anastrepha ludens]XP_054728797.1 succinate dehydrogenase assembly factor 4, mitochondrial-like [Anastrepha obliqua]
MSNIVKQSCRLCQTAGKQINFFPNPWKTAAPAFSTSCTCNQTNAAHKPESRAVQFSKKIMSKVSLKNITGRPLHQQDPWKPWPNSVNPHTGEIGGPAGPEPTRYGDWERKGRVSDF